MNKQAISVGAVGAIIILILMARRAEAAPPEPGLASVDGLITDHLGNPINQALVKLDGLTTLTDSSGHFSFSNIEPGLYIIIVSKGEYYKEETMNIVEGINEITVAITPEEPVMGTLTGVVTDSETNELLSDVQITIVEIGVTYTNTQGYFLISDITPGTYTVRFEKDGYYAKEY